MPTDEPPSSPSDGLTILAEMDAWRAAHPTATLAEIETALDERLSLLRRRLLTETVSKSLQADWSTRPPEQPTDLPDLWCASPAAWQTHAPVAHFWR